MENLEDETLEKLRELHTEVFNLQSDVARLTEQKKTLSGVLTEWLEDYEGWLADTLPNGVSQVDRIADKARNILSEI